MNLKRNSKVFEKMNENIFEIGNAKIHNIGFDDAIQNILDLATKKKPSYVVTPNLDHIVLLENNRKFLKSYQEADIVLADGMPLIWASYLLGNPLKDKISGSDITPILCKEAANTGHKVFLLGAAEGVGDIAAKNLRKKFPTINIVGTYSPPMDFENSEKEISYIFDRINSSNADLIFLAFNTIKQEVFMNEHHNKLKKGVMLGVGATIDFLAEKQKRAPVFMQKAGLEWFYRLCKEPRRMYKRYFRDLKFIFIFIAEFIKVKKRN